MYSWRSVPGVEDVNPTHQLFTGNKMISGSTRLGRRSLLVRTFSGQLNTCPSPNSSSCEFCLNVTQDVHIPTQTKNGNEGSEDCNGT